MHAEYFYGITVSKVNATGEGRGGEGRGGEGRGLFASFPILVQCPERTVTYICFKNNFERSTRFISFFVSDVSSPLLGENV